MSSAEHDDPARPPSREGLSDAQVWEWSGDRWQLRSIGAAEEPNLGGSVSPLPEPDDEVS